MALQVSFIMIEGLGEMTKRMGKKLARTRLSDAFVFKRFVFKRGFVFKRFAQVIREVQFESDSPDSYFIVTSSRNLLSILESGANRLTAARARLIEIYPRCCASVASRAKEARGGGEGGGGGLREKGER